MRSLVSTLTNGGLQLLPIIVAMHAVMYVLNYLQPNIITSDVRSSNKRSRQSRPGTMRPAVLLYTALARDLQVTIFFMLV